MSDFLPRGWTHVGLFDVVDMPQGQVDPRVEPYRSWPLLAPNHIESGAGRWTCVETAEAQGAISGKYLFEPGDVVYSKIRPYLRKVALVKRHGLCSADMYPLRAKATLDPGYLLAVLLSSEFTDFTVSVSTRTGIPKVNRQELAQYRLKLPPLPEQRKIAAILSAVDEVIEKTEAVIQSLQALKKAMMQELLTRGLPGRHTRFKQTEIGEVPEEWEVARTGGICRSVVPGRSKPRQFNGTIPWVTVPDIGGIYVGASRGGLCVSLEELSAVGGKTVPAGTVLMSCAGRLGIVAVASRELVMNQQLHGFICSPSVLPEFLALALSVQQRQMDAAAGKTTIPYLNKTQCEAIALPLPSRQEQEAIVLSIRAVLQRIEHELAIEEQQRVIKSALMSVLLTGELRVTPDQDAA